MLRERVQLLEEHAHGMPKAQGKPPPWSITKRECRHTTEPRAAMAPLGIGRSTLGKPPNTALNVRSSLVNVIS